MSSEPHAHPRFASGLWRLRWHRLQRRLVPNESQRLFALTLVIGVVCGVAAVAFHFAIGLFGHHLIERAMAAPGRTWIAWTLVTPTLGGCLCGALLQYVVPNVRGSGIPQVKVAYALRGGRLRLRDSFGKFVIGSLQIGSGASLGREGPTVQICAGIASALGRLSNVSPLSRRRLLPVGVAAGIAAAFNAPIAAVTFTIEEVIGTLDQTMLSGVIVAAALAAVIERSVLGTLPIFEVSRSYGLHEVSSLLLYLVLGIVAALVAVVFTDSLLGLRRWFAGMKTLPPWARPAVGGLVTGALAVLALLYLGSGGVTGGGYHALSEALHGHLAARVLVGLCAMKLVATAFSYGSGGAGGIFAPSLFMGGTLGGAVGVLDVALFHHAPDTVGSFALVGMGAMFAGVIRAPITSVLIIVEMTGGYGLMLPLMIANMTAYAIARGLRPTPIYEALLAQDGIDLGNRMLLGGLESIRMDQVLIAEREMVTFGAAARTSEIATRSRSTQDTYPVVDGDGRLIGAITGRELLLLSEATGIGDETIAADVMSPPVSLTRSDDLRTAYELMRASDVKDLPIVDGERRVVGYIDEATIAQAYLRVHEH